MCVRPAVMGTHACMHVTVCMDSHACMHVTVCMDSHACMHVTVHRKSHLIANDLMEAGHCST